MDLKRNFLWQMTKAWRLARCLCAFFLIILMLMVSLLLDMFLAAKLSLDPTSLDNINLAKLFLAAQSILDNTTLDNSSLGKSTPDNISLDNSSLEIISLARAFLAAK